MTISTTASTASFNGSGSVGPFTFNFRFFNNSHIVVLRTIAGVTTTLQENTDYTLTGAGSYNGGTVILTTALLNGQSLQIKRVLPLTQLISIRNLGSFLPAIHEDTFDGLTMIAQQISDVANVSYALALQAEADNAAALALAQTAYDIANSAIRVVAQAGTPVTQSIITADASIAPVTVDITGLDAVVVTKDDETDNTVTIEDSSGATIIRQANFVLTLKDEWVSLIKIAGNWKRIG